ncbi:uncharacterized protein V6R79_022106 [Siganus canaliculatus]
MSRTEELLAENERFRNRAFKIIAGMVEWSNGTPSPLVDEILHSIFFLGILKTPPYEPKDILGNDELVARLRRRYPRPFDQFFTELPKRSPFSCVLDMIVDQAGQGNQIRKITLDLQDLIRLTSDAPRPLVSTTICISQSSSDSERYYGVSMSTSGRCAGRIIVAASCLSGTWDGNVADAVMTYYPIHNITTKKNPKNPHFDGTITLPEQVQCQTFRISDVQEMAPCRSCKDMFGLMTTETRGWAHGNCAEVESLSNLLKHEPEVRRQVRQRHITEERRNRVQADIQRELCRYLRELRFNWDQTFYTPQAAEP